MMPNLPVKLGKGVVAVLSDEKLDFLDSLGTVVYVKNQDEIDRFTGFTGSGTGFVFHSLLEYARAAQDVGVYEGMDRKSAEDLTLQLFEGALEYLKQNRGEKSLQDIVSQVHPKKGTTAAGIDMMDDLGQVYQRGIEEAIDRAKELSEEMTQKTHYPDSQCIDSKYRAFKEDLENIFERGRKMGVELKDRLISL